MIAVDTNLLVYAHRAGVPQHEAARAAVETAAGQMAGWGVALPCVAELFMVVTHPSSEGRPSTADEVARFVGNLRRDAGMRIFAPNPGLGIRLLNAARQRKVSGARIFDLQIGLMAVEAGATELWTHDRDFLAPEGLTVRDPLQVGGS